ncbi:MAG: glycosyltransferase [Burkholderiales bacterium]|nr:glycosyltransferase [Burkholderiales bacterium]
MNIYATIHSIGDEAKGTSYLVRRMYEEISLFNNVKLVDSDFKENLHLPSFSVSCKPSFGPAKLGRSREMYNFLDEHAKAGKIDLIHNHGLWMMPNVYAGKIAKKYGLPLITSPHGTFAKEAWESGSKIKKIFWPLLQKPALEPTSCFHATSLLEYEDIRRMGYKQAIAIIPSGMDIPTIESIVSNTNNMKTLLFLGRIHPIKGLDLLLKAWHNVQNKFVDWQLKIVGPDNYGYLDELKKMASELNLKRVIFQDAVYGDEKILEYVTSNIYVLSSYSENFAISVAEALALGIPCIVTRGAPWEELNSYNAGAWVDTNVESLTNGMDIMMSKSSEELRLLGQNGVKLIEQNYSWKVVRDKMNQMYDWVVNPQIENKPDFIVLD